jgi:hypothetical protein
VEVHYIDTYEDSIRKPTKHCLKGGEEKWKYGEGVDLFKVHCMHVWNYHGKIQIFFKKVIIAGWRHG